MYSRSKTDLAAAPIEAADHDVGVGVIGVVVVDRGPVERPSGVLLDLPHQAADVLGQVERARVLGRHNEPELVRLAAAGLLKARLRNRPVGAVEHAGAAVTFDAVALDVREGSAAAAAPCEVILTKRALTTTRRAPRPPPQGYRLAYKRNAKGEHVVALIFPPQPP